MQGVDVSVPGTELRRNRITKEEEEGGGVGETGGRINEARDKVKENAAVNGMEYWECVAKIVTREPMFFTKTRVGAVSRVMTIVLFFSTFL